MGRVIQIQYGEGEGMNGVRSENKRKGHMGR